MESETERLATILFGDDDIRSRLRAADALALLADEQSLTMLTEALGDRSWLIRGRACTCLGQRGDRRSIVGLLHVMDDSHEQVRKHAIMALVELGWQPVTATEWARYLVAKEMELSGEELGVVPLDALLLVIESCTASELRVKAVALLGKQDSPDAKQRLVEGITDQDDSVRKAAMLELDQIGWHPDSTDAWKSYLIATKWAVPSAKIQDASLFNALFELLKTGEYYVYDNVATLLGKLGDKVAVGPLLNELTRSPSSAIAQALVALEWKPSTVEHWVDYAAAIPVGNLGLRPPTDPSLVQPMMIFLSGSDSRKRDGAARLLGEMASPIAAEQLTKIIESTSLDCFSVPLIALEKILQSEAKDMNDESLSRIANLKDERYEVQDLCSGNYYPQGLDSSNVRRLALQELASRRATR